MAAVAVGETMGSVLSALVRYRIAAWVVGVGLLVLVLVGVPLQYLGHDDTVVAIVGPLHGFLYMAYLVLVADLAYKLRWHPVRILLIAAAGTIPFLSFVAERRVTRMVHAESATPGLVTGAEPAS